MLVWVSELEENEENGRESVKNRKGLSTYNFSMNIEYKSRVQKRKRKRNRNQTQSNMVCEREKGTKGEMFLKKENDKGESGEAAVK